MPCTSERRPMKFDGPTFRHRNPATTDVSSDCAASGAAPNNVSASKRRMAMSTHLKGKEFTGGGRGAVGGGAGNAFAPPPPTAHPPPLKPIRLHTNPHGPRQ